MTGFELDPEAMDLAYHRLAVLRADLEAQRRTAENLAEPLLNGTSDNPVAKKMRWAFRDRADKDGGVQAVLQDYVDELDDLQDIIKITRATYTDLDSGAAAALPRPDSGPRGEVR